MSRILSLNMIAAMHARETGKVPVFLMTIRHPAQNPPIRLSTDPTTRLDTQPVYYGTVSNGETYLYVGARVQLPDDKAASPPTTRFSVMDINQDLVPLVRSIKSPPPTLQLDLVLSDTPDIIELSVPRMDMTNVQGSRENLTFECSIDLLVHETFPAWSFGPAHFPGLF